ncbi:MAG TPA: histidinol-phosphate transaminase [Candidatus Acidoferrum sp.]|nr:histidinol-phosphate transaminase [Candidatus Limnocylindria bacterium]
MRKSIHELVPEYFHDLPVYIPGKPIEEVERELKIRAVKLASNENPLGPSPLAVEAIQRALADSNRYPDGGSFLLHEKLSGRHKMPPENIFIGLGSSELIDLAARALLRPGLEGITSNGSFALFRISIRASGAKLIETPLKDYTFDLGAMARAITADTRVIYIANPNNPTGTMFNADAFDAFLEKVPDHVLVVLDEAYCDYVERTDYSRSLERVRQGHNLLVLRTFSKVHGLAGLRLGYGIGPAEFLAEINKLRTPFNTSNLAQAAALAALDDYEHVRRSIRSNREGLQQMQAGLAALDIQAIPSFANFVLVELGTDANPVSEELLKLGVIVRPMRWMRFPNAIRVTVGTREENEKFLRAMAQIRASVTPAPGPSPR